MSVAILAVLFSTPAMALATAAAAAAVPVVIHLLNRRRYQIVDWAAMRFLQAALKRNVRRMRLEHWLLLAVRTLVIVLPALAMAAAMPWAEPMWSRLFPGGAPTPRITGRTHHVLVLDASLSMTARRDDGSAFERAQARAIELVRRAPGGDGFSVVLLGAPSQVVVPGPGEDANRVARELGDLRCTHGNADVGGALAQVEELLTRAPGKFAHRLIYLFTDLQRSQWASPPNSTGTWAEAWQRLHARANMAIVDVGGNTTDNLAVTSLQLADSLVTAGSRSALTATVQNFGPNDRKQVNVELWQAKTSGHESHAARVERAELIDVPPGASATLSFPVEFRTAGDYLLEVRLEPDVMTADDRRALPVTARDSLPVLLVNGRPNADRLATATGWLAAALDPFPSGPRPNGYPAKPRLIDESRLGDPDLDFNTFDCIYLCDLARPTLRDRDRLEAYVRRGGSVVVVLGPRVDPEAYNRLFYRNGDGLLPAKLSHRQPAGEDTFVGIGADDDAFRRPPLAAFAGDDDRAALLSARFKEFWRVETTPKAPPRRVLNFLPPASSNDSLVYDWQRGRGRVVLVTSTMDTEWTGWPISPSFLPFVQELLRSTARQPPRRELAVGEPVDEILPDSTTAADATITLPDATTSIVALALGGDAPRLRFTNTDQAGIYSVAVPGQSPRAFAVNTPAGGEGDLVRVAPAELPVTGTGDATEIVTDPARVLRRLASPTEVTPIPEEAGALGTAAARWLLLTGLFLLFVEPILAWRLGSARGPVSPLDRPTANRWLNASLLVIASIPLVCVTVGAIILVHAALGGELLAFLPRGMRGAVETAMGVSSASPGEGTRWRLDRLPVFTGDASSDRWLVGTLAAAAIVLAGYVYFQELRRSSRFAGWPMAALRFGLVLVALGVLLPQLRLVFEREGWPDVVVLIDDSQSMGVQDEYADVAVRKAVATIAPNNNRPSRLELAQALLTSREWLDEFVARQTRPTIYCASERLARLTEVNDVNGIDAAKSAVRELKATGSASRLGDAIHGVLQEYRGASLAGVIVLTDGITTEGEDLVQAGRAAARAGVPLTFVGLGDAAEPRDLSLTDLRVDDVVHVGDRLTFEARLSARGGATGRATVVLSEKQGEKLVELARVDLPIDSDGGPAKVRLAHSPREPGDRTFVLEALSQPGENDLGNNRIERNVTVAEFRRTRVLMIDGRPRYDFRAVKSLLERETETVRGNKSVELKVLLLDADADYARQDRTAIEAFPATKEELFSQFDVVILGDVDPLHPKLGDQRMTWLAEFVKEKGGGLLVECGPGWARLASRKSPLAGVMPAELLAGEVNATVRPSGYLPRLTIVGRSHPVFRFSADEAENLETWAKLKPFFWAATEFKPKPAAEVLAELPPNDGAGPGSPLVLQQFVGAGRVMLLGFEETWRWRFRADEPRFNQFWLQAVRYLSRTRSGRPEVRLDRQTPYRRGEPIRVTVRFPDDKPPPAVDAVVKVTLERTPPGGVAERQNLLLRAVAGARATYETIVTRTPEGNYSFVLTDGGPGASPHAEARVLPPPGEMDRLRMNRADMERASQSSRGRFYTLADVDQLLGDLPPFPRVTLHQPRPPWPIWNAPIVFVLTLGLLTAEWALRKRRQLL